MHPEERDVIESGEQRQGSETTHFSVMDSEGNVLSNSYTLNLRYGSKWSVEGMGFLLNGSMDAFSFAPGCPNYFGVIGNRPNLLAPNKRPASNMAPVLVTKGREVVAALGTPGGPAIPTALAQVLFLILSHKKEPQTALQLGRIHHQGWPDVLYKEEGSLSENMISVLSKKGYSIQNRSEPIGDFHAVFTSGNEILAVSDFRREGSPNAL
jgi:gamma-glutamyltranspeptidase/glutathione hydrolase